LGNLAGGKLRHHRILYIATLNFRYYLYRLSQLRMAHSLVQSFAQQQSHEGTSVAYLLYWTLELVLGVTDVDNSPSLADSICTLLVGELTADPDTGEVLSQKLLQQLRTTTSNEQSCVATTVTDCVRYGACCLFATLLLCSTEVQAGRTTIVTLTTATGPVTEGEAMTVDGLLRCWLLRSQEVLLCTPNDDAPHALLARALQQLRVAATLYCNTHLHTREGANVAHNAYALHPLRRQAFHSLWLCEHSTGYTNSKQDGLYSPLRHPGLLSAGESVGQEVLQVALHLHQLWTASKYVSR
jgi:hypothetical protein